MLLLVNYYFYNNSIKILPTFSYMSRQQYVLFAFNRSVYRIQLLYSKYWLSLLMRMKAHILRIPKTKATTTKLTVLMCHLGMVGGSLLWVLTTWNILGTSTLRRWSERKQKWIIQHKGDKFNTLKQTALSQAPTCTSSLAVNQYLLYLRRHNVFLNFTVPNVFRLMFNKLLLLLLSVSYSSRSQKSNQLKRIWSQTNIWHTITCTY